MTSQPFSPAATELRSEGQLLQRRDPTQELFRLRRSASESRKLSRSAEGNFSYRLFPADHRIGLELFLVATFQASAAPGPSNDSHR